MDQLNNSTCGGYRLGGLSLAARVRGTPTIRAIYGTWSTTGRREAFPERSVCVSAYEKVQRAKEVKVPTTMITLSNRDQRLDDGRTADRQSGEFVPVPDLEHQVDLYC